MNPSLDPGRGPLVLIVNQHGDNRGDEAAMRGMIAGLVARWPDARFTVIHQFNNPSESCVPIPEVTDYLSLRLSPLNLARLMLVSVLVRLGVPVRRFAGASGRRILEAFDSADVVISAPGGPYFGDIYAGHEVVHWFFVWLGHVRGLPLALYAPSAGPFANSWLAPLRRRGFRWFDLIALREQRSARLLETFVPGLEIVVTADAALQDDPLKFRHEDADVTRDDGVLNVVAAFRRPDDRQERHDQAVVDGFAALAGRTPVSITLLPQVHGQHRDQPYLESLAQTMSAHGIRARVVDEHTDSDEQRALVAAADLVVAGRYHPAVFAVASQIPVLVIPYEHKAHGLAEAAGIDRWTIDVRAVTSDKLRSLLLGLHDHAEEARRILAETGPELRARAALTSDLVAALLPSRTVVHD